MSAGPIDTTLPVDNSPIVSAELRGQFFGLQNQINDMQGQLNLIFMNPSAITLLNMTVTDPPAQAEVQAIADKVDEIVNLLSNWSS